MLAAVLALSLPLLVPAAFFLSLPWVVSYLAKPRGKGSPSPSRREQPDYAKIEEMEEDIYGTAFEHKGSGYTPKEIWRAECKGGSPMNSAPSEPSSHLNGLILEEGMGYERIHEGDGRLLRYETIGEDPYITYLRNRPRGL